MTSIQSVRMVGLTTQRSSVTLSTSTAGSRAIEPLVSNKADGALSNLKQRGPLKDASTRRRGGGTALAKGGVGKSVGTHVASVGGGPRGVIQAMAEAQLIQEQLGDFQYLQSLGAQYAMKTTIIEKRGEEALGRGNAWGPEQGLGTTNTGSETVAEGLLDYDSRLTYFASTRRAELQDQSSPNPVVAALLHKGFDGSRGPKGTPMVDRSMLTRAQQGQEEADTFNRVRQGMAESRDYDFYRLDVKTNVSVEHIDITSAGSPDKPVLTLKANGSDAKETLQVDGVRLNTGTTLVSPIRDQAVAAHSFIEAMDHHKLNAFLQEKGLLDQAGHLKPGAKIVLGGTSLSAYDQLLALLSGALPVMERDDEHPMGYKVRDDMKERYQGAIVFVSNTAGKWVPPRHAHTPIWSQTTAPLGNVQEQHALFLHQQGEQVFGAWSTLADASVALSQGITPEQVSQRGLSTEALLQAQHASSMQSAAKLLLARDLPEGSSEKSEKINEATHTLEGARRQAYFSTLLGMGMAHDPGQIDELNKQAPATYAGRGGYPMIRALPKAISEPGTEAWQNNVDVMKRFESMSGEDLIASPMYVHDCAAQLFEAGIATHMQASYGDIRAGNGGQHALSVTGRDGQVLEFDAFVVSPTFQRKANSAVMSLEGQNQPMHPQLPEVGRVAVNRRILSQEGKASNVQDFSLNGKGGAVNIGGNQWRKTAVFAYDVNNRESAVETARGLALQRLAKEHLVAAGFEQADQMLEGLYRSLQPTDAAHDKEAAQFKPHFHAAMTRSSFLEAASMAANGDGETFKKLAEVSRQITAHEQPKVKTMAALMEPFMGVAPEEGERASARYADALAKPAAFKPSSNADYQQRFVDLPLQTHEKVYEMALQKANARLAFRALGY